MKSMMQLGPLDCRWPVGEEVGERQKFCGETVAVAPYCIEHREKSYVRESKKRKAEVEE